jgi:hypothetical protein
VHKTVTGVVTKTVCSDKSIAIKLQAEPVSISILQVYMSVSECEDDEV